MRPVHDNGKPDYRYSVTLEHIGHPKPRWVARFDGELIGHADENVSAWEICARHQEPRQAMLSNGAMMRPYEH